jgi:hypothetical protein
MVPKQRQLTALRIGKLKASLICNGRMRCRQGVAYFSGGQNEFKCRLVEAIDVATQQLAAGVGGQVNMSWGGAALGGFIGNQVNTGSNHPSKSKK